MNIRNFIRGIAASILLVGMMAFNGLAQEKAEKKLGWKLAIQTWTFRKFTLEEALEKAKALNIHYAEAYFGQTIGGGIDGITDFKMEPSKRVKVLELFKKNGITLVSMGVVVPKTREEWVQLFDFAKAMGLKNIVSEPKPADLGYLSTLCDKYQINIAIHDHPKPSFYWSPDTLLKYLKLSTTKRIGSCADVGHWRRSGKDAIQCLKQLQGKIIEMHLKDVINMADPSEETIWGQGGGNIKGVLEEMHKQHWKGVMSIEYESTPENDFEQVKQSIAFFNKVVDGLN